MKKEEMKYNTILSPFKWFILENFPYIEEDFDALTNWQLFCKIGKEINKIIEKVNLTGEQVEILTNSFNDLKEYIDNYFENLDVQEEINNKLDEMAEDGELAEIIAQYLSLAGCLAFKTLNDLKNATNLVENSICMTFGKNTYNDGKGEHYLIRTITSSDIVDNDNIVAVNFSNTLIAEKQKNLQIENIENEINLLNNKKIIIIGDSYTRDNGSFVDITKYWYEYFAENLDLTINTNLWIQATPGGGFISGDFYDDFDDITETISNLNEITDVFVVGGWNDRGAAENALRTAMTSFKTLVNTKCPNAKITIGFVGKSNPILTNNETTKNNRTRLMPTIINEIKISGELGFNFIKNAPYILHNYNANMWEADGVHPNQNGQEELGKQLSFGFKNGFCDIHREDFASYITITAEGIAQSISPLNFVSGIHNDQAFLKKVNEDLPFYITVKSDTNLTLTDGNQYNFGKLESGYVAGTGRICETTTPAIFQFADNGSNIRVNGFATIYIEAGHLFLKGLAYYNNQAIQNRKIDIIYLPCFDFNLPSLIS